jgi:ATP-dependent protease HslVU (ClpYQ) peptidase subunit
VSVVLACVANGIGYMVADSMISDDNGEARRDYKKIVRLRDGSLMGFAGSAIQAREFIRRVNDNIKSGTVKPIMDKSLGNIAALWITKKCNLVWLDGCGVFSEANEPKYEAIGSGGTHAKAAFAAFAGIHGKGLRTMKPATLRNCMRESVKIACNFNNTCGGKIRFSIVLPAE